MTETLFVPGDDVLIITPDGIKPARYDGIAVGGALSFTFHSQRRGTLYVDPDELDDVVHQHGPDCR